MSLFVEEHQEILRALLEANVDFILIGGYAVMYHGYRRTTGDMDLWLRPNNDNKRKFLDALNNADFDEETISSIAKLDFEKTLVFTVGEEPQKVDFLTRVSGIEYKDAEWHKITADIDGLKIPVIHLNDLVISKMSSDRLKDKLDIEELQKIAAKR